MNGFVKILFLAGAFTITALCAPRATDSATLEQVTLPNTMFLPQVGGRPHDLTGRLVYMGVPLAGESVWLRHLTRSLDQSGSVVTHRDGHFYFDGCFHSFSGREFSSYSVIWQNAASSADRVHSFTQYIGNCDEHGVVTPLDIGTLDLAALVASSPASGAQVRLPVEVKFTPQPESRCQLLVTQPDANQPDAGQLYQLNLNSATGLHTLAELPERMATGIVYSWSIRCSSLKPFGALEMSTTARDIVFDYPIHGTNGISGTVMQDGSAGFGVTLRIRDRATGAELAKTNTRADGSFYMPGCYRADSAIPNRYAVEYVRTDGSVAISDRIERYFSNCENGTDSVLDVGIIDLTMLRVAKGIDSDSLAHPVVFPASIQYTPQPTNSCSLIAIDYNNQSNSYTLAQGFGTSGDAVISAFPSEMPKPNVGYWIRLNCLPTSNHPFFVSAIAGLVNFFW